MTAKQRKIVYKMMLAFRDQNTPEKYGLCKALNELKRNQKITSPDLRNTFLSELMEIYLFNPNFDKDNNNNYVYTHYTSYWYGVVTTENSPYCEKNQLARDLALEFAILFCDEPDILKSDES